MCSCLFVMCSGGKQGKAHTNSAWKVGEVSGIFWFASCVINMSFRRLPFQFSTTDPVERQRELERRFGLPSSRNMFVDVANPLSAGTMPRDSSISSSSPRLQHRVPIFVEGYDHPINTSVDSSGVTSENKKPNVRVIPIEIEGAESKSAATRHRTFSGPAGIAKEQNDNYIPQTSEASPLKHSMADLAQPSMTKSSTLPRVHTIPIKVEGTRNLKIPKAEQAAKSPKLSGCTATKPKVKSPDKDQKRKPEPPKLHTESSKQGNAVESALKKIENVLEELKSYEAGVQEFSGTTKEKQYRYLDEMLTRCMLKMDEIDTMGNDNLRSVRKNAVKKIQACIDLLESKANTTNEDVTPSSSSQSEVKTCEETKSSTEGDNEITTQNDIEMSGQNAEQETSKILKENKDDDPLQNPVEMIEYQVQDVIGDTMENCDISQKGDIEMTESQTIEQIMPESKEISTEVVLPQDTVTNVCEVKVTEKTPAKLTNEVPEVEMSEIKRTLSSQNLNSEIPEVEMADSTSVQNTSSDSTIPKKEEKVAEIKNLELASDVSQEDIEMKDAQSTLDDIKETIAEDSVKCNSSQANGKTESNLNKEIVCNSDVTDQDGQCDNDIKTVL